MSWDSQRALVLGAAGFCGAHLCEVLVERGARVVALDREVPPDSWLVSSRTVDKTHFVTGDILDLSALRLLLERHRFDFVFHLAAQPIVSLSNILPVETMQVNVVGTTNVCEAIRLSSSRPKLVFASSGAVYGATNAQTAIQEDEPFGSANNIYAATKAAADGIVRCYAQTFGLQGAACRWMNTYGPGDPNFSRVVPATFARARDGKPGLIAASDGSNVLELLHVRDMIEAYLRVGENLHREDVRGQAFNFGGGQPLILKDVVARITRAWNQAHGTNVPETPEICGPPVQAAKFLDISQARETLGWAPQIDLDEGLREAARWYGNHLFKT